MVEADVVPMTEPDGPRCAHCTHPNKSGHRDFCSESCQAMWLRAHWGAVEEKTDPEVVAKLAAGDPKPAQSGQWPHVVSTHHGWFGHAA